MRLSGLGVAGWRPTSELRVRGSSPDELLAAIDVDGRANEPRVRHEVDGQYGDVGRVDDASNGQRRT